MIVLNGEKRLEYETEMAKWLKYGEMTNDEALIQKLLEIKLAWIKAKKEGRLIYE